MACVRTTPLIFSSVETARPETSARSSSTRATVYMVFATTGVPMLTRRPAAPPNHGKPSWHVVCTTSRRSFVAGIVTRKIDRLGRNQKKRVDSSTASCSANLNRRSADSTPVVLEQTVLERLASTRTAGWRLSSRGHGARLHPALQRRSSRVVLLEHGSPHLPLQPRHVLTTLRRRWTWTACMGLARHVACHTKEARRASVL